MESSVFIYVAECEGFLKVGIARSLKSRFAGFQTGNPFKVSLVYSRKVDRRRAALFAEKQAHEKLTDLGLHHRGEWFKDITIKKVIGVVNECIDDSDRLPSGKAQAYVPTDDELKAISKLLCEYDHADVSNETGVTIDAIRMVTDGIYWGVTGEDKRRLSIFLSQRKNNEKYI